jgi:murein DD-endopeptidase MepM/ murein hydrolase activator NlpD
MKRTPQVLGLLVLVAAVLATMLTLPASADPTRVTVRLPNGTIQELVLDLPSGATLEDARPLVPAGEPIAIAPVTKQKAAAPFPPSAGPKTQAKAEDAPSKVNGGEGQKRSGQDGKARKKPKRGTGRKHRKPKRRLTPEPKRLPKPPTALRRPDGSPTAKNPGFVDALPGPSRATGVPNFVIRKFRVPVFLLPIYQAAGTEYGVRWEVLAAINEIETDYGRNLNVSSAGALGWMQFMPSTWRTYGVDANKDGKKDPYNPVDAIFAAARYLKAAGDEQDVHRAILAYNHAEWYVDSVMLRARLISGVPADLVGSLTGLTEGRFPVAAHARYADDIAEREIKRAKAGENAANVVESRDDRHAVSIFARKGAPVVAVNDGVVKAVGTSARYGRYLVLQDVYGNRYMYAHLGSTARYYPVPKEDARTPVNSARALPANKDPRPRAPASAGSQPAPPSKRPRRLSPEPSQASSPLKNRLFAHPDNPLSRDSGGLDQLMQMGSGRNKLDTYANQFVRPFGVGPDSKDLRLKRLRRGARVTGGTIVGRVGRTVPGKASHMEFQIRPAGKGAPRIDPKPILDGWKLLEATAVYRASGRNVLHGHGLSAGQVLMMPKPLLQRRVLHDSRVDIYPAGRQDIRTGQIDRRVLATLEYLAESGFRPTVTSLKSGHGFFTASGNVSAHSSGNAVDVAKVNGVPILGHQERGGVTEQAVRQLMRLQGTVRPDQIISLLDLGRNTMALPDHANHIHVGFKPRFGANSKTGKQAEAVLKPGQWGDLLSRLRRIQNPVVPTKPSRYAVPVPRRKHRGRGHTSSVPPLRRLRPSPPRRSPGRTLKPLRALGR